MQPHTAPLLSSLCSAVAVADPTPATAAAALVAYAIADPTPTAAVAALAACAATAAATTALPSMPLAGGTHTPEQESAWEALTLTFNEDQLHHHRWDWEKGEWLPYYTYQPIRRIGDIWTEHATGLGGHLPARVLDERWAARWRRNKGSLKTEAGRRRKVTELVAELMRRPRWSLALVLRFLADTYDAQYTPRQFCDMLRMREGHQNVIRAADSYCT